SGLQDAPALVARDVGGLRVAARAEEGSAVVEEDLGLERVDVTDLEGGAARIAGAALEEATAEVTLDGDAVLERSVDHRGRRPVRAMSEPAGDVRDELAVVVRFPVPRGRRARGIEDAHVLLERRRLVGAEPSIVDAVRRDLLVRRLVDDEEGP